MADANSAKQPDDKPKSFCSFWRYGFRKAFKGSWGKYGNALIVFGLLYAFTDVCFRNWADSKICGYDVSLWMQLLLPSALLLAFLAWNLGHAPYEIYKEQHEEFQKQLNQRDGKIQSLEEKLEAALDTKLASTKLELERQDNKRLLHDSIVQLQNQIRTFNGAKRYFEIKGEDRKQSIDLVEHIYNQLYVKIGADAAALFSAATSTQKKLERFGFCASHLDFEWTRHLDFLDAHIDCLKTIIEKQM